MYLNTMLYFFGLPLFAGQSGRFVCEFKSVGLMLFYEKLTVLNPYQGLPASGPYARAVGLPPEHSNKAQGVVRIETQKGFA